MDEKEIQKSEVAGIGLQRLLQAIWQKVWLVVLTSVLGAELAFAGTYFLITPEYEAAAKFYVNNSSISVGSASVSLSSGDLTTSRNLVDSYIVILNTRESLNDVIDYAGVDRTYAEVKKMLSAEAVNETEIFQVTVTSTDPQEAEAIANAIAYILPKRISSIIEGTSAKVVEAAVVPSAPSSPSYTTNTLIGFLLGFVLTVAIIALREIFDITIRTEEDVTQICKHPVLAAIPDMAATGKGSGAYYYGYGGKKNASKTAGQGKQPAIMGEDISFASSEAYKLLRTKLQFSFADGENQCRVIGISSALSGEGKSVTAVNLAYTLSQLNKRVILIDCDMRRPTIAEKLEIHKKPGFSSYLTGQVHLEKLIQYCGMPNDEKAFHVITAGENPPNPVELLSSARMSKALTTLREHYDYVIMDLPPVGEVSDALAVAKETDGMLLVVRQDYCNRSMLGEAVRQFEFVGAKILGVIYNCAKESSGKYGHGKSYYKRYYKKYYNKGNRTYESSYAAAQQREKMKRADKK